MVLSLMGRASLAGGARLNWYRAQGIMSFEFGYKKCASSQGNRMTSLTDVAGLFNVLPDAVVVVDGSGRIAFANTAVSRLLHYAPEELIGQPLGKLVPQSFRAQHEKDVANFRRNGRPGLMSARPILYALGKSGREMPVSISIANIDLNGDRFSVAVLRDAAAIRDQLRAAIAQSESDVLTGLGNRLHLTNCIAPALASRRPFALLFLDLRRFKQFNDQHGHQAGDQVLRLVAKRIQGLIRTHDVAIRYGGDEFIILLDLISDPKLVASRSAAIVDSIAQPFNIDGLPHTIGVNVGASIHPRDGTTEEKLLEIADRNMYLAKQQQRPYVIGTEAGG